MHVHSVPVPQTSLFVALLFAAVFQGCGEGDGLDRSSTPADVINSRSTGNPPVDEIIAAALTSDEATLESYWSSPPKPCSSSDISLPACPNDVPEGTLLRVGTNRCGIGAPPLEGSWRLPGEWELYSVELDDVGPGLTYRIILDSPPRSVESAVELYVRTAKPGLEALFDATIRSYSWLCGTAEEATAGVKSFHVPPSNR